MKQRDGSFALKALCNVTHLKLLNKCYEPRRRRRKEASKKRTSGNCSNLHLPSRREETFRVNFTKSLPSRKSYEDNLKIIRFPLDEIKKREHLGGNGP